MPYINVDEAYILDNTGLQVDQSVDYANANSNRNLLDNPFFTVNQRNFTSVTATNNVYSVDRWKVNNGGGTGGSISKTSAGYIQLTTGSTYISYQQMFGTSELADKTVTMSINDNGTIYAHSFTVPARGSSDQSISFNYKTGCNCNFFTMNTSAAYGYIFQLSIGTGYSATIRAVKLELGSYSTLINDVPPKANKELSTCQYYFRRLSCGGEGYVITGYAVSATEFRFTLPFAMRNALPSNIPFSGTLTAYHSGGNAAVTALTRRGTFSDVVAIGATTSGLTAGTIVALYMSTGSYIDLSADL